MAAEPIAGWQPPAAGQPSHWLDVDGRPACDPSAAPAAPASLNPWRPSTSPCPECSRLIAEFRALVAHRGFLLSPRYRYPDA